MRDAGSGSSWHGNDLLSLSLFQIKTVAIISDMIMIMITPVTDQSALLKAGGNRRLVPP